MSASGSSPASFKSVSLLAFGALGIVYGDIGTSPLYALNEAFFGHHPVSSEPGEVLGVLSLFFWALTLIITVKYLVFILRADNGGEGGVFSELALLKQTGKKTRSVSFAAALLVFGACLLYADGLITPAISVLSAVEGLKLIAPATGDLIVPVTMVILIVLFAAQKAGTGPISRYFGLIMLIWFAALAGLALPWIFRTPGVLQAVHPAYAVEFLFHHGWHSLFVLGAVTLCITGGEALYADMGHFGRAPIRLAWTVVVYPALVLNYFGQGAFLLSGAHVQDNNLFFSMAPEALLIPLVILATLATVIASQALISGAYSLTQQAIGLGFLPRMQITHTSHDIHGQIYMPAVNWILMIGCLALVAGFQSSSNLAAAYGLTVTATMGITTIGFYMVSTRLWNWNPWIIGPVCLGFLILDLGFFSANTLKFADGGYVPVIIGLGLYSVMELWNWGKGKLGSVYLQTKLTLEDLLSLKGVEWQGRIPAKIAFFSPEPVTNETGTLPLSLQTFITRYHVLPSSMALITVRISHKPVWEGKRTERFELPEGLISLVIRYGYMEEINLGTILEDQGISGNILVGDHEIVSDGSSWFHDLKVRLFRNLLRQAFPTYRYFGLRGHTKIIREIMPVKITPASAWLMNVE